MVCVPTILRATDFPERSEAAFRVACWLARDHGARFFVLHFPPMGFPGSNPLERRND